MYDEAMGGIKKHMIGQTKKSGLIFTQELHPKRHPSTGDQSVTSPSSPFMWLMTVLRTWQIVPKQDHLVCFLGGSFLLGVTEGGRREVDWQNLDPRDKEDLVIGKGIVESCMKTHDTAT